MYCYISVLLHCIAELDTCQVISTTKVVILLTNHTSSSLISIEERCLQDECHLLIKLVRPTPHHCQTTCIIHTTHYTLHERHINSQSQYKGSCVQSWQLFCQQMPQLAIAEFSTPSLCLSEQRQRNLSKCAV